MERDDTFDLNELSLDDFNSELKEIKGWFPSQAFTAEIGAVATRPRSVANLRVSDDAPSDPAFDYKNLRRIQKNSLNAKSKIPRLQMQYLVLNGRYFKHAWSLETFKNYMSMYQVLTLNGLATLIYRDHKLALELQSLNAVDYRSKARPDAFVNVTDSTDESVLITHLEDLILYKYTVYAAKTARDAFEYDEFTEENVRLVVRDVFENDETLRMLKNNIARDGRPLIDVSEDVVTSYILHERNVDSIGEVIENEGYSDRLSAFTPQRLVFPGPLKLPYRICAPPRQGKSAIALSLMSLVVKLDGIVLIGVAPFKLVPISEWIGKFEALQWTRADKYKNTNSLSRTVQFHTKNPQILRKTLWERSHNTTTVDARTPANLTAFSRWINMRSSVGSSEFFVVSDIDEVGYKLQSDDYVGASFSSSSDVDMANEKKVLDEFASIESTAETHRTGIYTVTITLTFHVELDKENQPIFDDARFEAQMMKNLTSALNPNVDAIPTRLPIDEIVHNANVDAIPTMIRLGPRRVLVGNSLGACVGSIEGGAIKLSHNDETVSVEEAFGTETEPPSKDQKVHILFYSIQTSTDVKIAARIQKVLNKRADTFVVNVIDEAQTICLNDVANRPEPPPPEKMSPAERLPRTLFYGKKTVKDPPVTIRTLRKLWGTPLRSQLTLVSATQLPSMMERGVWGAMRCDGPAIAKYSPQLDIDTGLERFIPTSVDPTPGVQRDLGSSPFYNYERLVLGADDRQPDVEPYKILKAGKADLAIMPSLRPTSVESYYGPTLKTLADERPMDYFKVLVDKQNKPVILNPKMWGTDAEADDDDEATKRARKVSVADNFALNNPSIELRVVTKHLQMWLDRSEMRNIHSSIRKNGDGKTNAVAIPVHVCATSRKAQYFGGFLEEARFLSMSAASRIARYADDPMAQTDMTSLRLDYGVAFLMFASAERENVQYSVGADCSLDYTGFEASSEYFSDLRTEVSRKRSDAQCYLAIFDPAVPENRPPGITPPFSDPRYAGYGLKRGKVRLPLDTTLHDGRMNDYDMTKIAPDPNLKNASRQNDETLSGHEWVKKFVDLNQFKNVRLIGYPVPNAASAVKIAMRVHGIVNLCVVGYNMLSAGLTLQTTLAKDVVYRELLTRSGHEDGDANNPQNPMKVCFVPRSISVASSVTSSLDEQYQLYGRCCVDMRDEKLPEDWRVEVLGSGIEISKSPSKIISMLEVMNSYSKAELLFASMPEKGYPMSCVDVLDQVRDLSFPINAANPDTKKAVIYTLSRAIGKRKTVVKATTSTPKETFKVSPSQLWRLFYELNRWADAKKVAN